MPSFNQIAGEAGEEKSFLTVYQTCAKLSIRRNWLIFYQKTVKPSRAVGFLSDDRQNTGFQSPSSTWKTWYSSFLKDGRSAALITFSAALQNTFLDQNTESSLGNTIGHNRGLCVPLKVSINFCCSSFGYIHPVRFNISLRQNPGIT